MSIYFIKAISHYFSKFTNPTAQYMIDPQFNFESFSKIVDLKNQFIISG
jgi:hypothetical protein